MSHARELLKSPFKLTFSACAVLLFWTYVATPILAGLKKPWERAPIVAADRDAARMRAIARQQAALARSAGGAPSTKPPK